MRVILSLCVLLTAGSLYSQNAMPVAFELGKANEKVYEKLAQDHAQSLLEVANFDLNQAFDNWVGMMMEMDAYSEKVNFDLKGIKAFLHVFWTPEGKIQHIGYLLRPDSRNLTQKEKQELDAFFSSFSRQYQFPLRSSRAFNHYTVATFPTVVERAN